MDPDFHHKALPKGDELHWYRVDSILGQGGFGITYLATDTNLEQQVAIKEYLPNELAVRVDATTVQPISDDHSRMYRWGLDRFLLEAKTLAKFKHPNIVRVQSFFEQNNTAYMVMEYEEGQSLADLIKAGGSRSETALLELLEPILDGLAMVHEAGSIHRDIKPDNIFIRRDGSPVLLDFGSARHAISGQTRTLTSLVTPGFAPFEQYHDAEGKQGPWTDIYALGATLYRAITGKTPMESIKRGMARINHATDPYLPLADLKAGDYSAHVLEAIDCALRFLDTDRPQTVGEWRSMLTGQSDIPPETSLAQPKTASGADVTRVTLPDTAPQASQTRPATQPQTRRTDTPATVRLTEPPPEPAPAPVETKRGIPGLWVGVAVIAVAALVGIGLTQMNQDRQAPVAGGTSNEAASPVQALLQQARGATVAGNLVRPAGTSALDYYRQVLRIDPDNGVAVTELDALLDTHIADANDAIVAGDLVRAEMLIEDAAKIDPAAPGIVLIKEKLTSAQAASAEQQTAAALAEEKSRRIRRLLQAAAEDANSDRFDEAERKFRELLSVSPDNAAAREGLVQLERKRSLAQRQATIRDTLSRAQQQFDARQYKSARASYQSVLALDKNNATARSGLARIKAAMAPKQYSVALLPWSLRGADRHEQSLFGGLEQALASRRNALRLTHSHYDSFPAGAASKKLTSSGIARAELESIWARSGGLFSEPELDRQAALDVIRRLQVDTALLGSVSIAAETGKLTLYLVERRTGKVRKTEGELAFPVWGYDAATAKAIENLVLRSLPKQL